MRGIVCDGWVGPTPASSALGLGAPLATSAPGPGRLREVHDWAVANFPFIEIDDEDIVAAYYYRVRLFKCAAPRSARGAAHDCTVSDLRTRLGRGRC